MHLYHYYLRIFGEILFTIHREFSSSRKESLTIRQIHIYCKLQFIVKMIEVAIHHNI